MLAPMNQDQLKDLVKAAVLEVLQEHQDLLRDTVGQALEDIALARAIEEGEASEEVSRETVFQLPDHKA